MKDRRRAWTASLIYVVGTCCPGTVYVTAAATMQWFPRDDDHKASRATRAVANFWMVR
jgi:hypothetical protein